MISEINAKKLTKSEKLAKNLILKIRSEGKKVKCENCGGDRLLGRRVCKKCHSSKQIELNKKYRKKLNCFFCGVEILVYDKNKLPLYCRDCHYEQLSNKMKKKWAEKRIKISSNLNKIKK